MSQNVTEVFRATVPSVGFVLKAGADIDGKQNAYRRRIAEDAEGDESIRRENIGAIPLLPGHLDQLERRMTEIVGKTDAHAHLDAVIPTRGTTAVVAASEAAYLAAEVVYGTYRNSGSFNQLEWIKKKRLYNMPLANAEQIGIVDKASANAKSILFLVSGNQGHRDKPSVFRIKRGKGRKSNLGTRVILIGGICRTSCVCPNRFPVAAALAYGCFRLPLPNRCLSRSTVCKLWIRLKLADEVSFRRLNS